MQTVVDEAVSHYERRVFWDHFAAAYDRLADDTESWDDVRDERDGEAGPLRDESP
jgi:hypothetical protein